MADRKITDLTALAAGSQATGDLLTIVDVSESAAADKNKKITTENFFKGIPGDVGIGTASPSAMLHINGGAASTNPHLRISADRGLIARLGDTSGSAQSLFDLYDTDGSTQIVKFISGSGADFINTGGNLGIGTTSPARNLHVHGSDSDTVQIHLTNSTTGVTSNDGFSVVLGSDESAILNMRENNPMRFFTNDSERMRIDNSGRVLIGTTSAPDSGATKSIQVVNTSTATLSLGRNDSTISAGNDIGAIRFWGNAGSSYQQCAEILAEADGTHANNDKPSRLVFSTTADSGSSPTERMRIDSSGNVGIGTTSVDYNLVVKGSANVNANIFAVKDSDNTRMMSVEQDSSGNGRIFGFDTSGNADVLLHTNGSSYFNGGNVGIGHTSPASLLTVGGDAITSAKPTVCVFPSSGDGSLTLRGGASTLSFDITGAGNNGTIIYDNNSDLLFKNGTLDSSTEKMRIDSSGRLLSGTTTPVDSNSTVEIYRNSGQNHVRVQSNSLANGQYSMFRAHGTSGGVTRQVYLGVYKHSGITNPGPFILLEAEDGANVYYWSDNSNKLRLSTSNSHIGTTSGTVVGTQTSDLRLKNVGANVSYGLAEVKQLQPKQYALKTEPDVNKLGFIAQEVESIIPEAVFDTLEELDGHQEGDRTKLGMEYVQLIPVLVNAIKELSAEVDTLKTKVAALEAG